jgi:hypothetical protein
MVADKEYIDEGEVEHRLSINRKTLQRWRLLGQGPRYRKFGAGVRYSIRDLEVWCASLPTGGEGVPSSALKGAR